MNESEPKIIEVPSSRKGKNCKPGINISGSCEGGRISNTIRGQERRHRNSDMRNDFEKAPEIAFGEKFSNEVIKKISGRDIYWSVARAVEYYSKDKNLKEGSIGCDLETAIGENIDELINRDNTPVNICNVKGVKEFDERKIDAIAFIYTDGENQQPEIVTIKAIPASYESRGWTDADIEFKIPENIKSRNDSDGEYWDQLEKTAEKIVEKVIEKKKKKEVGRRKMKIA